MKFVKVNSDHDSLAKISGALSAIKAAKLEIVQSLQLIDAETAALEQRLKDARSASLPPTSCLAAPPISKAAAENVMTSAASEEITTAAGEEITTVSSEEIKIPAPESVDEITEVSEDVSTTITEGTAASEAATSAKYSIAADTAKKVGEELAEKVIVEAITETETEKLSTEEVPATKPAAQYAAYTDVEGEDLPIKEDVVILEPLTTLPNLSNQTLARISTIVDAYNTPIGYHLPLPFQQFAAMKKRLKRRQLTMVILKFLNSAFKVLVSKNCTKITEIIDYNVEQNIQKLIYCKVQDNFRRSNFLSWKIATTW